MAVSLEGLQDDFREKLEELLSMLVKMGIEMRPYATLRSLQDQAVAWRQSRSREEVAAAAVRLQNGGAAFLAETLEQVGPRHGPHVTNALPGLSWHQWGEAADCFWAVNGRAEWSVSKLIDGVNGYQTYARSAEQAGLAAGGLWKSLKDWPHVQLRKAGSPVLAGYTLPEIDAEMQRRFA